jgi:6-phosphogluconolactonase (cycloisomerase 2 family)
LPKFKCPSFVGALVTLILLGVFCLWSVPLRAATGDLTFIEKHNDGGGVSGLNGARQVNISPDGKHVYVVSIVDTSNNGAVAVFSRDETTGQLTFFESHVKNHPGMRGVQDVDVSPNGEFVYLGSITDQAVVVFSRDASSGALTFIESVNTPAPGYGGAQNITSLDISADGLHMYSSGAGRITQWSVDAVTGSVVPVAGIQDRGLFPASDRVRLTPDGKHLYMSDINGDAVLGFERDTTTLSITHIFLAV